MSFFLRPDGIFLFLYSSITKHSAYPGFTVGLLGVPDGGVGNTFFRINLHSEDNMMTAQ